MTIPGIDHHEGIAINAAGDALIDDLDTNNYSLYSQARISQLPQLGLDSRDSTSCVALNDVGQFTGRQHRLCCGALH